MPLDCIDIFKHPSDPNTFYGVYHVMIPSISNFYTFLAKSPDGLNNWEKVVLLEKHASQAKIWLNPNGEDILMAYESSPGFNGNNLAVVHYSSLEDMKFGKSTADI